MLESLGYWGAGFCSSRRVSQAVSWVSLCGLSWGTLLFPVQVFPQEGASFKGYFNGSFKGSFKGYFKGSFKGILNGLLKGIYKGIIRGSTREGRVGRPMMVSLIYVPENVACLGLR